MPRIVQSLLMYIYQGMHSCMHLFYILIQNTLSTLFRLSVFMLKAISHFYEDVLFTMQT